MQLQVAYIVILAFLALLGGLLAARLLRQSRLAEASARESAEHVQQAESDIGALRVAKLEIERRLAIEEQKSARIPELEKALTAAAGRIDQSRQARAAADSELAVARESITRLEQSLSDHRERLAGAERNRDELAIQAEALRDHMNQMEQMLATRSEAAAQNEQAAADLRQRLAAMEAGQEQALADLRQRLTSVEAARDQALARIDSAVQAKAGAEATLARAASQIQEKSDRVQALEEELRQARGEIETRYEAMVQAKAALEANLASINSQAQERAQRLAAAEEELHRARSESQTRLDSLSQARHSLEIDLAGATSQVQERSQRLAALEEELRQVRGDTQARLDSLGQARSELEASLAAASAQVTEKSQRIEALVQELRQARAESDAARNELGQQRARLAALQEGLEQERRHGEDKLALIASAREQMTQEFRALAEEVIRRHGEDVTRQNRDEINVVLTPLRERLSEFQAGLLSAHDESMKERMALADQIRTLSSNSLQMVNEAQQLASILKGKAEGLGAWGEVLLSSILERSGLREGEDFVYRESYSEDGSRRLRPDVVITLPAEQRVLIDSKVPLGAYENYVNSGDDASSEAALAQHAGALAAHILSLADREPRPAADSRRDYTVMFVPVEGALAAALRHDPDLMGLAVEKNIAIATPGTLMMALRSVANLWEGERRNRRAETIAERAGKLYDSFAAYLGDMEVLGDHLVRARQAYEDALARLASGRDNLIDQVEELKALGAKATKPLRSISPAERRFTGNAGEAKPSDNAGGGETMAAPGPDSGEAEFAGEPPSEETGPGMEEANIEEPPMDEAPLESAPAREAGIEGAGLAEAPREAETGPGETPPSYDPSRP